MPYSIFENTMADMTYQEVEKASKNNAIVLFPISVIEEHGPHLPLGTDTYIAHQQALEIKKNLAKQDIPSVIVPPYYWGINFVTGAFTGSFNTKRESMIQILGDILHSINSWGFKNAFTWLSHGDLQHSSAILDAFKTFPKDLKMSAYFVLSENESSRFDPDGKYSEHILTYRESNKPEPSKYVDVHAGKFETSFMLSRFPHLVKTGIAKNLKNTQTTHEDFLLWRQGGEINKKVAPLGYCGNPANIDIDFSEKIFTETCKSVTDTIYKHLAVLPPQNDDRYILSGESGH